MAKAGDKIKEAAAKVAEKILPKSTKDAVKKTALEAGMGNATSDDPATQAALEKAKQEILGSSSANLLNSAGGYDAAIEAGKKGELSKLGLGENLPVRIGKAQIEASQGQSGEAAKEARQARNIAATEEDVSRKAAYQAARNTGANRAAASVVGSSVDTRGNQSNALSAIRGGATSTQADFLAKQGYNQGLEQNAANTKAGAFLTNLGGIFSGFGQGLGTGASIGGAI